MKILLVENNSVARLATSEQLEALGHRVVSVPCAEEAIKARPAKFDVIVLDIQLSGMSSDSFILRMTQDRVPGLAILAVSAGHRPLGLPEWIPFLQKPFDIPELVAALEQTVAAASAR